MTATLSELRNGRNPAYEAKMIHRVPDAGVKDRRTFILSRCEWKVVLDIGASGPMHEAIVQVAKRCYGIDKPNRSDVLLGADVIGVDLDDLESNLPLFDDVDIVVCGEVLEHLSCPGWLLHRLKSIYRCPVIITVPNAFSEAGMKAMARGIENVNLEHVAYYSYHTLKELVTRHGYEVAEHYWYGGRPMFSEGLIFVVR